MQEEIRAQFGEDTDPYLGGAHDLIVVEVTGPFRVTEYDGSESIRYRDEEEWEEA